VRLTVRGVSRYHNGIDHWLAMSNEPSGNYVLAANILTDGTLVSLAYFAIDLR